MFVLEELPNYLSNHYGGALYTTHYLFEGEVIPDPTMKRLVYPEKENNNPFILATNTLWDIDNQQPLARIQILGRYSKYSFMGARWQRCINVGANPELREIISRRMVSSKCQWGCETSYTISEYFPR